MTDEAAVRCPQCGQLVLRPNPGTSVIEDPLTGKTYKVTFTADGPLIFEVTTRKGYIDFTGATTGVNLTPEVLENLRRKGIRPTTRFLSRAAAHRALKEAGWTSKSGKRVGPSAFYEEDANPATTAREDKGD